MKWNVILIQVSVTSLNGGPLCQEDISLKMTPNFNFLSWPFLFNLTSVIRTALSLNYGQHFSVPTVSLIERLYCTYSEDMQKYVFQRAICIKSIYLRAWSDKIDLQWCKISQTCWFSMIGLHASTVARIPLTRSKIIIKQTKTEASNQGC
jgi:hypothetical protein